MIITVAATTLVGVVMTARTSQLEWLVLGLPFLGMLVVASRFAPRAYRLAADGVHVERKSGDKVIPYAEIRAVDVVARPVIGLSLAGSNGLFGRFGQFWNPRLGLYRLFLSNTHTIVWLSTTRGLVGLSPERADEFVERLRARLAPSR